MKLADIPRVKHITKDNFINDYFKPQKPVVLEQAIEDWPAYNKWNLDYIKEVAGNITVPLYDDRPVQHKDGFNEPHAKMKMAEYVDLLKKEPTKYRIFLWNILKEVPALQKDYKFPDFGLRLLKGVPMMFFGGRDSYTFMHYDIDLANIFHFHFDGEKEVVLFPQSETEKLYKVPHSLITHESIDFSNPDYLKWPALKKAKGFKTTLSHGEVLYMPEGYWHYMKYNTPGFSMSLRGLAHNPKNLAKASYNIVVMRYYDVLMRKLKGQDWIDWKNKEAISRTNKNQKV
ncbi:cupin-like domain-containing protein [Maribacter sp. 1_MG-2023]|uniref:cupin-like domain-containing protein n=1 Tax=Maribacter sp. 1_MG-2023 TaxID=3062677 RepID=UPI0026E3941F|nr:cupin-like domain-containing protein [Maribacter sp. 1_MG-2023]MDO6471185.1 cupin-like domain-containing protein [Maribacter sp. 1_MG-2023]